MKMQSRFNLGLVVLLLVTLMLCVPAAAPVWAEDGVVTETLADGTVVVTETTTAEDGTVTVTETRTKITVTADGTEIVEVFEKITVTDTEGIVVEETTITKTVTTPDGTVTKTVTAPDGTVTVTVIPPTTTLPPIEDIVDEDDVENASPV